MEGSLKVCILFSRRKHLKKQQFYKYFNKVSSDGFGHERFKEMKHLIFISIYALFHRIDHIGMESWAHRLDKLFLSLRWRIQCLWR